jgi:sec-independent protein translocase protein TatB
MPSLSDNIFIFVLALLLLGPEKLPKLAREIGKWVGEFRRASADFRLQMEDELRVSEQAEKQQKIDAMVAANPAADPNALPEPEHPHLPPTLEAVAAETPEGLAPAPAVAASEPAAEAFHHADAANAIATSGELSILPPRTGLPTAQSRPAHAAAEDVSALLDSIPAAPEPAIESTHG